MLAARLPVMVTEPGSAQTQTSIFEGGFAMISIRDRLHTIKTDITEGRIEKAQPWRGADVVILEKAPVLPPSRFYPDPRFVETPHVAELSWLFHRVGGLFSRLAGYGFWKEELFGTLGNTAADFQEAHPDCSATQLLLAVADRAQDMALLFEQEGTVPSLPITFNNVILDDLKSQAPPEG